MLERGIVVQYFDWHHNQKSLLLSKLGNFGDTFPIGSVAKNIKIKTKCPQVLNMLIRMLRIHTNSNIPENWDWECLSWTL